MQLTTVLPLAITLVAAPLSVAAQGRLAYALGTEMPDGQCKTTADYEADFDALKGQTDLVRGYAADRCNFAELALPAAKNKDFKVVLGIWPDTDDGFSKGKAAVQQYAPQFKDQVYGITVGSETLYRGNFTGEELADKMQEVKQLMPDFKIGTADTWNRWADGTADAVIRSADLILVNAFAYWQGSEINNASKVFVDDITQALDRVQNIRGEEGYEFWVGETGWPTAGGKYGEAVPSVENAQTFWKEGICFLRTWGIDIFAFEAFDEPNKPVSKGENGESKDERHWGMYSATREPKYDLSC